MIDPLYIGFPELNEKEITALISRGEKTETKQKDYYIQYCDQSGSEIYFQFSKEDNLLGYNVHFNGQTIFPVSAIKKIIRNESPLDGALLCWADPENPEDPESGLFPFAFDVPDFYSQRILKETFPQYIGVQLAAFPEKQPFIFNSERHFMEVLGDKAKIPPNSVIPSGLFTKNGTYQSKAFINGIVKQSMKLVNNFSGHPFYHLIIETAGGEIDMAIATSTFSNIPEEGFIISGDFWLSGKIRSEIK